MYAHFDLVRARFHFVAMLIVDVRSIVYGRALSGNIRMNLAMHHAHAGACSRRTCDESGSTSYSV
jgi:hypothetical protein